MVQPQIVWLRRDLRLADQPAFHAAAQAGPVIPVYVLDDDRAGDRCMGGASRWWLHHSLAALERDLHRHHSQLILRRGDVVEQLCQLVEETGAAGVHANRHYEPWWRDAEQALWGEVDLTLHDGLCLMQPGTVKTGGGTPFKIFTPFYKALVQAYPGADPLPEPSLSAPESWPASDSLDDWGLLPEKPDWAGGFRKEWAPGSAGAAERIEDFLDEVGGYESQRNLPSIEGSSRLSPHLHFGEISPAQVWHALKGTTGEGPTSYRRELVWRDYAQNVLCQFPEYPEHSYRDDFDRLEWRDPEKDDGAASDLAAWQQGRTGYPIVDAGMRQLWHTGWMHNRVRMIAASFLIKHLLIDWRHGERWFWDTLVDADYGSNGTNWQWVAGTGVDSNMFVRIMAPLSQSEKFDAAAYIREWVPELADLDEPYLHDPAGHGCSMEGYPEPLIEHRAARQRALDAYERMKSN